MPPSWDALHNRQKIKLVLSVVSKGEALTAYEITQRIAECGVEPPTPQKLGMFLRRFLEFKYMERVKGRDSQGHPITYWRLT